jgi:hypothetical protein
VGIQNNGNVIGNGCAGFRDLFGGVTSTLSQDTIDVGNRW